MTPEEFAKCFYLWRKQLLDSYFKSDEKTDVSNLISSMQLNRDNTERLKQILNGALRDGFYGILLAIDGEAQIGNVQEAYNLFY